MSEINQAERRAPRVLLCVTGGIAAYKACEVLRDLQKLGCDVRVTMTEDATRFVGVATFEALTGHPVATSLYGNPGSPIPHVENAEWADLALVVPCTANVMAKVACGIADDCVTSTLLAAGPSKTLLAPAMNVRMWQNPATQRNLRLLRERGVRFVLPASGRLACGDVGEGKLANVSEISSTAFGLLSGIMSPSGDFPLMGRRLLVTAGPTQEAIDPVRFIANRSSGKMGYAIARAARDMGASVTLVSGPVAIDEPDGVRVEHVVSAAQMLDVARSAFRGCDAAVLAAAVSDYTPANISDHKLKKGGEPLDRIDLVETTDILATLSVDKGNRVVVGFAAETENLLANARKKLASKGCDMIVANDVSRDDSTFGSDTDRVTFVTTAGAEPQPTLSKDQVAYCVCKRVADLLPPPDGPCA